MQEYQALPCNAEATGDNCNAEIAGINWNAEVAGGTQ
jgi:hypothetical protein